MDSLCLYIFAPMPKQNKRIIGKGGGQWCSFTSVFIESQYKVTKNGSATKVLQILLNKEKAYVE